MLIQPKDRVIACLDNRQQLSIIGNRCLPAAGIHQELQNQDQREQQESPEGQQIQIAGVANVVANGIVIGHQGQEDGVIPIIVDVMHRHMPGTVGRGIGAGVAAHGQIKLLRPAVGLPELKGVAFAGIGV